MPSVISNNVQSRWKDCYAPSPRVRLTLRTNGEEVTQVVTPQAGLAPAGFDAPTVLPTVASAGAGSLNSGTFVAYRYVYASSRYPFVDNAVTGGGDLWPRSIPSPASATFTITGGNKNLNVTVTKTTRSDVDWIWIYRTTLALSAAIATTAAAAGQMFYVGRVANDSVAGTTVFLDSTPTDTNEILEIDNYPAPTMQFCVFDGTQWFGIGNFPFDYTVTVNSTSTVTLTGFSAWFSGRDGQTATFDGITTGGYDGRGSFYFKRIDATTAGMYSDAALTNLIVVPFNGTTKIHLSGFATTLYRSKPLNPFSWGKTDVTFNADGSTTSVASEFAVKFGAGAATAMSVVGNDSYLVLSFEQPSRMVRLALNQSDSDNFALTAVDIDTQYSLGSHFSQVLARYEGGKSALTGVDPKSFSLISTNGNSAMPVSDAIFRTMRSIFPDVYASRFFHSIYDSNTELTAFWIKTRDLGGNLIDTALLLHGPTGRWSIMTDHNVSASATIFDPQTKSTFTMLGLESGHICTGFDESYYGNILRGAAWATFTPPHPVVYVASTMRITNSTTVVSSQVNVSGSNWLITIAVGVNPPPLGADLQFWGNPSSPNYFSAIVTAIQVNYAFDGRSFYTFNVDAEADLTPTLAFGYSLRLTCAVGLWAYTVPTDQTVPPIWFEITAATDFISDTDAHIVTIGRVYVEGTNIIYDSLTDYGNNASYDLELVPCYIGIIPCRHRRYTDLDEPTKSKSPTEIWSTMDNVTKHYCRIFEEYSSAYLDTFQFQLKQLTRGSGGGGNPSLCWNTKTAATQALQTSFGFEILEVGYKNFQNFNYVLKFRAQP